MKKGGGTGPMKPWQPSKLNEKVPIPFPVIWEEIS